MSASTRYEVGDEVRFKKPFVITEVDSDDDTYQIEHPEINTDLSDEWFREEHFATEEDSDDPIVPGDVIRRADNPNRIGVVKAICKGQAWIDWAPGSDEAALGAVTLNLLRKLSDAEKRQLAGVRG